MISKYKTNKTQKLFKSEFKEKSKIKGLSIRIITVSGKRNFFSIKHINDDEFIIRLRNYPCQHIIDFVKLANQLFKSFDFESKSVEQLEKEGLKEITKQFLGKVSKNNGFYYIKRLDKYG